MGAVELVVETNGGARTLAQVVTMLARRHESILSLTATHLAGDGYELALHIDVRHQQEADLLAERLRRVIAVVRTDLRGAAVLDDRDEISA